MILALPLDGEPVTGRVDSAGWRVRVENLIGRYPTEGEATQGGKTNGVRFSWLVQHFRRCPAGVNNEIVQHYARAYLWYIFGSVLFPDAGGDHCSWMWLDYIADWQ